MYLTSRRAFLGGALASLAAGLSGRAGRASASGPDVLAAGYPYNHVRALIDGRAPVEGFGLSFERDKIGNLNTHIFEGPQTRAFSEVGLGPFMLARANDGFRDYSLIPVFPLRTFRHKSIFVHADAGIDHPSDLKGRRVATPGYSQTSLVWIRGMLQDEYGVRPEDIEWVVSAEDSAAAVSGTVSSNENVFPDNLEVVTGPGGKDESDLLTDRDVDALFHAIEPRAFVDGNPKVKRLFDDVRQVEQDYFLRTGIFPIMHAVAVRNDLVADHPDLPAAIFRAYSTAKALEYTALRQNWFLETLPWFSSEVAETTQLMGDNFFPYGIDANRKTLEALFRYSHEQGLAARRLTVEDLFVPSTLDLSES